MSGPDGTRPDGIGRHRDSGNRNRPDVNGPPSAGPSGPGGKARNGVKGGDRG